MRDAPWPAELELARWYLPHLQRLHDDAAVRRATWSSWSAWPRATPSAKRFLTELTLDPPEATSDERARRIWTRTT